MYNLIRASKAGRICTHRPEPVDKKEIFDLEKQMNAKLKKANNSEFNPKDINVYLETYGIKTLAKNWVSLKEKEFHYKNDPLPLGAKSYVEEIWLYNTRGLIPYASSKEGFETKKGSLCEDDAIKLINEAYRAVYKKVDPTYGRRTHGNLSGCCDIWYDDAIRDVKCPKSWQTFRNKTKIETDYHWQLIAYCYLYDAKEAHLDYVLMPTPEQLQDQVMGGMSPEEIEDFIANEKAIERLSPRERVKSFEMNPATISDDIEFLVSRLQKCQEYYHSLDYEKVMNYGY